MENQRSSSASRYNRGDRTYGACFIPSLTNQTGWPRGARPHSSGTCPHAPQAHWQNNAAPLVLSLSSSQSLPHCLRCRLNKKILASAALKSLLQSQLPISLIFFYPPFCTLSCYCFCSLSFHHYFEFDLHILTTIFFVFQECVTLNRNSYKTGIRAFYLRLSEQ